MASKKAKGIDASAKAREHYKDGNSCGDAVAKARFSLSEQKTA